MLVLVDSGPLYAAADRDDDDHDRCVETLQRPDLQLLIPALVVAEVTYMVRTRLGASAEAMFLHALANFDVVCPAVDDWKRISELVKRYADFPLGGTDASVIALAERLKVSTIVTLDIRHFAAVRPRHLKSFHLLPA